MVIEDPRQHPGPPRILILDTPEHLANQAALEFQVRAKAAMEESDRFAVALSGGTTPRRMLELLATPEYATRVDWSRVHVFWSDERCVAPDDPNSNYGIARTVLLQHVPVPAANVHRLQGELAPAEAASAYDAALRAFCAPDGGLDLIYLGLGADGHTASLFPRSSALGEQTRLCVATQAPNTAVSANRLTLTYNAINAARAVIFLVEGSDKAAIVASAIHGPSDPTQVPAQGVNPRAGTLTWMLDAQAASKLQHRS
ncbi:MAG: 6-phosphogluconolactonase [Candidatus Eremiobacteraeota bacterium]|nr:6-phosphogluconolactonase [Candidatus Eremiobacteraeota bacterium]